MSYDGQSVLITGGLGFIGSTLARRLVELGARVTLVDSLIPEYGGNRANIAGIEDRVTVNISDVRDEHSLPSLIRGQDLVFNLAGQTSHVDSLHDPYTDLEINCRAQLSILETVPAREPRGEGRSSRRRVSSTGGRSTCRWTSSIRWRPSTRTE